MRMLGMSYEAIGKSLNIGQETARRACHYEEQGTVSFLDLTLNAHQKLPAKVNEFYKTKGHRRYETGRYPFDVKKLLFTTLWLSRILASLCHRKGA